MTTGLSHPYHLDESTSVLRHQEGFLILISFCDENNESTQNRPRLDASHLGLLYLPMSHKKTPGLYGLRSKSDISQVIAGECHNILIFKFIDIYKLAVHFKKL